jgi:hypothetical protein
LWGACRWYFQTRALALGAISEPAVAKSITPAGAQLNHFLLRKKSGFEQGGLKNPGAMDFARQRPIDSKTAPTANALSLRQGLHT